MALQWMILACVVAAEAAVAALLTLPAPRAVRAQIVGLTSLLLQPFAAVLPFAAFQLLGAWSCLLRRGTDACKSSPRLNFSGSDDGLTIFVMRRYLLEERAQADVHNGGLHHRGACPLRENRE